MNELQTVFDPAIYVIEKHKQYDQYDIYDMETWKENGGRNKYTSNLLKLSIDKTHICIQMIQKSKHISGTQLMSMAEEVAKRLHISKVTVVDQSSIDFDHNIRIPLGPLSILATGISWYNKLGYVSEYQENIDRFNQYAIKHRLLSEFVDCDFIREFPCVETYLDKPIAVFFSAMKSSLKMNNTCEISLKRLRSLIKMMLEQHLIVCDEWEPLCKDIS